MASGSIDIKALNWLKGEIGETLDNVRQALEVYVEKQEAAKLDFIIANLHQITGTLHIVELFGPALLSEEMENLARALKNGQVKQAQDAFETLTRGILQLPAYLEHLRLGNPDQPIVLLSLLNDIRAAYGQHLLSESSMFSPDLEIYPDGSPDAEAPADIRPTAKKLRTVFQTALLGWFRDAESTKHLRKLSFVISQLESASRSAPARQLWWIAQGVVEALADKAIDSTVSIKSLMGQIDRQIKRVVSGGDSAIEKDRPTDLLKNLLFYVAQAGTPGTRASEIQKRFKLRELLPTAGDLSRTQGDLLGAGSGVMDNVAGAIREDVLSLKDAIDLFVRSKDHPIAELEPVATKLRTIADTLGILGLGKLRKSVKDQEAVLKELLDGVRPLSDDAVMNIASTLLYVESSLTNLHRGDSEVPDSNEERTESPLPDSEYRALVNHTVGEARVVLAKIKDHIVQFLASPGAFDILEPVPALANDIKGALSVMGYSRAADLLSLASQFVSEKILATRVEIQQQQLDALADAITGVEYFLENVEDDPIGSNNSLVLAADALRKLGMQVPAGMGSVADIPDMAPPKTAPAKEISKDTKEATKEKKSKKKSAEPAPPVEAKKAQPAPAPPKPAAASALPPEVDEEVREIFLEEATEESASINTNLVAWKRNLEDNDALRTLRRSFHTVKGSGRIVGAMEIGEFAWSVENMLNRVIDRTVQATPAVFDVLEEAAELLPKLIEELRANTSGGVLVAPLIENAHRIARGEPPLKRTAQPAAASVAQTETPAPATPVVEEITLDATPAQEPEIIASEPVVAEEAPLVEEITVSDELVFADEPEPATVAEEESADSIDPVLAEIFANEAHAHLSALDNFIAECRNATAPCNVNESVIRALHTLTGSSHLANIGAIAELADALEKLAKAMFENRTAIGPAAQDVMVESIAYFRDAIGQLGNLSPLRPTEKTLLSRVKVLRAEETQRQGERLSAAPMEFTAEATSAAPVDAELVDVFLLEAADAVAKNMAALDVWAAIPDQKDLPDEIRRRLNTLAGGARVANLAAVAQVCTSASQLIAAVIDAAKQQESVFGVLRRAHEWLNDALDIIKGHSVLDYPAGLIEELDSFIKSFAALRASEAEEVLEAAPPPRDSEADAELTGIFLDEATEILATIDDIMSRWQNAASDRGMVEELQRALHTLKGGARMANIAPIGDVSHSVETLLTRVVDGLLAVNKPLFELVQSAQDWISHSVDALRNGTPFSDFAELLNRLKHFDGGSADEVIEIEAVEVTPVDVIEDEPVAVTPIDVIEAAPERFEPVEEQAEVIPFPRAPEPTPPAPSVAEAEETVAVEYDEDLVDVFLEEGNEILHALDDLVARWSKDANNKAIISEIQRALHTLKGGARMARVTPVGDLSHNIESILESIGEGRMRANPQLIELMHTAYDWLGGALEKVRAKAPLPSAERLISRIRQAVGLEAEPVAPAPEAEEIEASPVAAEPQDVIQTKQPAAKTEAEVDNKALEALMQTREQAPAARSVLAEAEAKAKAAEEQVRVSLGLLDGLVNNAGEVSIYRSRIELQLNSIRFNLVELSQTVNRLREQLRKFEIEAEAQILFRYEKAGDTVGGGGGGNEDFDPLELDRFSNMQQLSRSLVETVGDLGSVQKMLDNLTRESEILLLQQSRVTTTLQDGLMRTRLVPFSSVVPRLRRIVRQTAKEVGKQVELEVIGAEGEMDRSVLGRLTPALEHMLRNGVDHGIELPAARAKANKPAMGAIHLRFWREGPEIVLSISDDGGGLDLNAIRAKAIERGLMVAAADMSDNEVMQFVLESGFSTAKKVTQISGRGVGMDVVNNEIRQLNGTLHIDSKHGAGTTFTVRLPLTVSVNQALMVNAGEHTYAIPLSSIDGVVRVTRDELANLNETEHPTYEYAGHNYRFMHLGRLLNVSNAVVPTDNIKTPLILARAADHRVALWVESIVARQEVVIKAVGPQVSTVNGISGATILSDGSVALILDIASLTRSGLAHTARDEEIAPPQEVRTTTVMVVDDSITVRRVTERLLKRHEFETMLAKDGVDALAQLQERIPDVMLLDIEMPRMDGYELATAIRNDARLKGIPIIMITSRTGDKHRERAMAIGVNMYMGKPYQDNELLENISKLLNERG